MAKKKPFPAKHKPVLPKIEELVKKRGVSRSIVVRQYKLPHNFFNTYVGMSELYDASLAYFVSNVLMKAVVGTLELDSASKRQLVDKLRVFDEEVDLPIKVVKTALHASINLSHATRLFAEKRLSASSLAEIRKSCEVMSSLYTATTLQAEVAEIKEMMEKMGAKS